MKKKPYLKNELIITVSNQKKRSIGVLSNEERTKKKNKNENNVDLYSDLYGDFVDDMNIDLDGELILYKNDIIRGFEGDLKIIIYPEMVFEFAKRYLFGDKEKIKVENDKLIIVGGMVKRNPALQFFQRTLRLRNTYQIINFYNSKYGVKYYQTGFKKKKKDSIHNFGVSHKILNDKIEELINKNGAFKQKINQYQYKIEKLKNENEKLSKEIENLKKIKNINCKNNIPFISLE